ncbi:hypothetical protein ALC60_10422, partial [Trachymyrmex zeteki]
RGGEKKRSHPPLECEGRSDGCCTGKTKKKRTEKEKGDGKRDERESRGNSNYASLAAKATDAPCSAISVLPRAANIRRQPPKWTTG